MIFSTVLEYCNNNDKVNNMVSVPNAITLLRIMSIPFVIGFLYLNNDFGNWLAALFFLVACISDYLDGYLARTLKQETNLGIFLDPLADKLLIASILLMLAGFGKIQGLSLIPGVIILCREILVSGLRELLAQAAVSLPVTKLAKWKTTLQMLALGFLTWGNPFPGIIPIPLIANVALWLSAVLTLITGYDYLIRGIAHINDHGSRVPRDDH